MSPISDEISAELAMDEQILWQGQPRQGVFLRAADFYLIPFSLLWGGFAVFWEYSAISEGAPLFFCLFGLAFVVVGLYITIGRFFIEARQRAVTYYAVSSERLIIVTGLMTRHLRSINLRTLSDLSLAQGNSRFGSIYFTAALPFSNLLRGFTFWPGVSNQTAPGFEQIEEARRVCEIIRNAQRAR